MMKKLPSTTVTTTRTSRPQPNIKMHSRLTTETRALMTGSSPTMLQNLPRVRLPALCLRYHQCQTSMRRRHLRRRNPPPRASQLMLHEQLHRRSRHRPCRRTMMTSMIPTGTTRPLKACQLLSSTMYTPCLPAMNARKTTCTGRVSLGHLQQIGPPRHHPQQIGPLHRRHQQREQLRRRRHLPSDLHRCLPCHLPLNHLAHPQNNLLIFEDQ